MKSEDGSLSEQNRYYLELGSVPDAMTLLDIWDALVKRKLMIVLIVVTFAVLMAILGMVMTTKYKGEIVVAEASPTLQVASGGAGSTGSIDIGVEVMANESLAMISSRSFVTEFIEENKLMPVLFAKDWDVEKGEWILDGDGKHPTLWDAYDDFNDDILDVETDLETNLTTVSIKWKDAKLAADWANNIIKKVNMVLRKRAIDEAERTLGYLNKELQRTTSVELKISLYDLVKAQKARIVAANVHEEYAFKIIDPAVIPEEPAIPYLSLILVAVGIILGLFFAITLALLLNLMQREREKG